MTFQPPPGPFQAPPAFQPPPPPARSRVDDVRTLASFMLAQGIATLAWALFCLGAVVLFVVTLVGGRADSETTLMIAIYAVFGVAALVVGTLQIIAAGRVKRFRNRTFGLVALWTGVGSFVFGGTFCCPTALALVIYGMIVLLDPSVIQAFEQNERR